jgi:hypothetical protein
LQKIVHEYPDWEWDNPEDDEDVGHEQPSVIIGVSQEGNTMKQHRELLKEAKKVWKEIG